LIHWPSDFREYFLKFVFDQSGTKLPEAALLKSASFKMILKDLFATNNNIMVL
jgi:hypothetical protein